MFHIDRKKINEDDLLDVVSIFGPSEMRLTSLPDEAPLLQFNLFKDCYVVDWFSEVRQEVILSLIKELELPANLLTIIQSKEYYPNKSIVLLADTFELFDVDVVFFVTFETIEMGFIWTRLEGHEVLSRVQFATEKSNTDLLVRLLNKTYSENFGDIIRDELNKIVGSYE